MSIKSIVITTIQAVAIAAVVSTANVAFGADGVLKGCRTMGDGTTVCPGDLGVQQQAKSVLKGCRKDAQGNQICPNDLGVKIVQEQQTKSVLKGCRKDAQGNQICPNDL